MTFRPSRSLGWLSLIVLALLVLIPGGIGALVTASPILAFVTVLPALVIGAVLLALVAFFPTMRYELDDRTLTLRYGPVLTYRIPLDQIESIQRRDLVISLWSSLRVPGLALFTVRYVGLGPVRMCATRAAERVIVIRTSRGLFGVTPADESGFLAALHARVR